MIINPKSIPTLVSYPFYLLVLNFQGSSSEERVFPSCYPKGHPHSVVYFVLFLFLPLPNLCLRLPFLLSHAMAHPGTHYHPWLVALGPARFLCCLEDMQITQEK